MTSSKFLTYQRYRDNTERKGREKWELKEGTITLKQKGKENSEKAPPLDKFETTIMENELPQEMDKREEVIRHQWQRDCKAESFQNRK